MTPLRQRALVVSSALLALLVLAPGAALGQPPASAHGGLPEGTGVITGQVVNEEDGRGAAGQEVVLYTLRSDGVPGLASTVSDDAGAFRFGGLATSPELVYLVGARSGGVPFGSRVSFGEGQAELDVELRISPLSGNTAAVRVGESILRVDRSCEGLRVNESHALSNPTSRVIVVPEEQRASSPPVLETELPAGAEGFFTPFGEGSLGLETTGSRVRYWGPVYPGSQELEFGYALPLGTRAFERRFPAGSERVVLLAAEPGVEIRGAGLEPGESRSLEGRSYRAWVAEGVEPAGTVAFQVGMDEAPGPAISFVRSELWIEADDAVVTVDENHLIELEGEPLPGGGDAPHLCLPLPAGAESLRFSPATLGMGIEPDPSGALAFRGPIPSGTSVLALRYSLPAGTDVPTLSRRFGRELPLLSVFIADTGVVPETTRLHRRRAVNRADRRYLHLEAFAIEPDETVEIGLSRLSAPRSLPGIASAGFTLLAAAAVAVFLSGPLRGARREPEAGIGTSEAEQLAAEREAVYAAIRDLEEDFETGKLTREDHDMIRQELKSRAVRLMQEERRAATRPTDPIQPTGPDRTPRDALTEPASAAPASGTPATDAPTSAPRPTPRAIFCIACGTKLPERARFCSQCGEKVYAGGEEV